MTVNSNITNNQTAGNEDDRRLRHRRWCVVAERALLCCRAPVILQAEYGYGSLRLEEEKTPAAQR